MAHREPRWLDREVVDFIHFQQLKEHGGLFGTRDINALESAINRPRMKWNYEPGCDLATLGAAYAFGIATNHPYADGNKRAAFVAMAVFLLRNGQRIAAPEPEAVVQMLGVASGEIGEPRLADWVRGYLVPA